MGEMSSGLDGRLARRASPSRNSRVFLLVTVVTEAGRASFARQLNPQKTKIGIASWAAGVAFPLRFCQR